MKFIFLDIDGVLNCSETKHKSPTGCVGIDPDKVFQLKQIVDATGAKIILTSTWKTDWFITNNLDELNKDGRYLYDSLSAHGLGILDKTIDYAWSKRGQGIIDFLKNSYCESFVILDDGLFDFLELGLDRYLVRTEYFDEGLTKYHVEKAINILNTEVNRYGCES